MALEDDIKALVTAVNANTAALSKIAGAATAKAATAPATTKPATKPAAAKAPVLADIQKAFGDYLTVEEPERTTRKANVAAMNAHFGVDRASNLDPSKFPEALAMLAQYAAGEDPLAGDDEGGGESLV